MPTKNFAENFTSSGGASANGAGALGGYHSITGKNALRGEAIRPTTLRFSASGATGKNTAYPPPKTRCAKCNKDRVLVLYAGKRIKKPVCINCHFEDVVK
jgi:hypothetical protein